MNDEHHTLASHRDLCDDEFLHQFETLSMDPRLWNHEAHVRMAWLYLDRSDSLEMALRKISKGIRKFDVEFATEIKYHHTITVAFTRIIRDRMQNESSWEAFLDRNPDLMDAKKLLSRYYSEAALNSAEARIQYIPPDRLGLKILEDVQP